MLEAGAVPTNDSQYTYRATDGPVGVRQKPPWNSYLRFLVFPQLVPSFRFELAALPF